MKRRARRVTIAAAALGAGVVAVLLLVNRRFVGEHLQAWHFQLTRETEVIMPDPVLKVTGWPGMTKDRKWHLNLYGCLQILSAYSDLPVVLDAAENAATFITTSEKPSIDTALRALQATGWSVVQQRFPRRAYVAVAGPLPAKRHSSVRVTRLQGRYASSIELELLKTVAP